MIINWLVLMASICSTCGRELWELWAGGRPQVPLREGSRQGPAVRRANTELRGDVREDAGLWPPRVRRALPRRPMPGHVPKDGHQVMRVCNRGGRPHHSLFLWSSVFSPPTPRPSLSGIPSPYPPYLPCIPSPACLPIHHSPLPSLPFTLSPYLPPSLSCPSGLTAHLLPSPHALFPPLRSLYLLRPPLPPHFPDV